MKVFKFGGASVNAVARIHNVAQIIKSYAGEPLLIVISAMGKTTNALEEVVQTFYEGDKTGALERFNEIKNQHLALGRELETEAPQLPDFFTEVEWLLHDKPVREFDYYYDQVVCVGELLSTAIISAFLNRQGIQNQWLDVRDVMRTDDTFRDARIDWSTTAQKVAEHIVPIFLNTHIVITQGFIGATDENESTTLGREGSDYTAAVFANLLNAESQTIWKDVPGVMNADPKLYKDAKWIQELSYREVIEMSYYGAQVIHPKTIKPLQNKNIPLLVKSFLHPDEPGTCIQNRSTARLPPIIVYKFNQVLIELTSKDYSFVSEGLNYEVYKIFGALKFKPNLTQNAAITMLRVVDDRPEKVEAFALEAAALFDVVVTKNLTLLTIRHYTPEILNHLVGDTPLLLKQQTTETVQVLFQQKGA
jgi:aspartate kinase